MVSASATDPHDDAQLLANSTEGFVTGDDTSFTLVSPGFMNIMGYDDKEELLRCVSGLGCTACRQHAVCVWRWSADAPPCDV